MLVFERTNDHIRCGTQGSLEEVMTDMTFCIGMVHSQIKNVSTEAAKEFREMLENACTSGTELNQTVFDHSGDSEWLENETQKVEKRNEEKLSELLDMLKDIVEGADNGG